MSEAMGFRKEKNNFFHYLFLVVLNGYAHETGFQFRDHLFCTSEKLVTAPKCRGVLGVFQRATRASAIMVSPKRVRPAISDAAWTQRRATFPRKPGKGTIPSTEGPTIQYGVS